MYKYLKSSFVIAIIGLAIVMVIEWFNSKQLTLTIEAGFTAMILAVLETSLSLDNAVVNASVIRKMDEKWKRRFLTWGMLIAVFGMRLIFPLVIVTIVANINPWAAVQLAFNDPKNYAEIMAQAHLSVVAFGGIFLLMVFQNFFLDHEKDIHWIKWFEIFLTKLAKIKGIDIVIGVIILIFVTSRVNSDDQLKFLLSGLWGLVTYLAIHGLSQLLEEKNPEPLIAKNSTSFLSAGFGLFLYLEILDASFSFDGVIGAFAITQNLIQIMVGLSIGAFFVRSLTLYLVENETLTAVKYLEHGAFYALGALALCMILDVFFHFPEWVTGLSGATILGISILWSIYIDRDERT